MKWVKDQKVENNLRGLGIKFEVVAGIPMSSIDRAEGMRRQVRLINRLDQDVLLRYGCQMVEDSAAFPMPVLQKERGRKTYWPIHGNHRLGAAAEVADVTSVDAYVVEVHDPVMLDLLLRKGNMWESAKSISREEAIVYAKNMVEKHGMSTAEAARHFFVKESQISTAKLIAETRERVEALGVPTNGFAASHFKFLHTISDTNSMREAASLIHKYSVRGKEVEALCRDVASKGTEAQRLAECKRWEEALKARSAPKKKGPKIHREANRERLFAWLTSGERLLQNVTTAAQAQVLDPAHSQILLGYWTKVRQCMDAICEEVRRG